VFEFLGINIVTPSLSTAGTCPVSSQASNVALRCLAGIELTCSRVIMSGPGELATDFLIALYTSAVSIGDTSDQSTSRIKFVGRSSATEGVLNNGRQ